MRPELGGPPACAEHVNGPHAAGEVGAPNAPAPRRARWRDSASSVDTSAPRGGPRAGAPRCPWTWPRPRVLSATPRPPLTPSRSSSVGWPPGYPERTKDGAGQTRSLSNRQRRCRSKGAQNFQQLPAGRGAKRGRRSGRPAVSRAGPARRGGLGLAKPRELHVPVHAGTARLAFRALRPAHARPPAVREPGVEGAERDTGPSRGLGVRGGPGRTHPSGLRGRGAGAGGGSHGESHRRCAVRSPPLAPRSGWARFGGPSPGRRWRGGGARRVWGSLGDRDGVGSRGQPRTPRLQERPCHKGGVRPECRVDPFPTAAHGDERPPGGQSRRQHLWPQRAPRAFSSERPHPEAAGAADRGPGRTHDRRKRWDLVRRRPARPDAVLAAAAVRVLRASLRLPGRPGLSRGSRPWCRRHRHRFPLQNAAAGRGPL